MKDVNKLLIDLVNIESISGNEAQIGQFIYDLLQKEGFKVEKNIVSRNRFNVIAKVGQPKIYLSAHMDTVQPILSVKETSSVIFGRGACDTKASIASMITAGIESKNQDLTDFGLFFTVGEETDFCGVKNILQSGFKIPFVIIGEPTGLDIVNGHFGILILNLEAGGKAAHSSVPHKGINAIDKLLQALGALSKIKLNQQTIMSIVKINGGVADNIIPETAEAILSFRVDPQDKTDYAKMIQQKVGDLAKVKPGLSLNGILVQVPPELKFIKKVRSVRYATELSFLKNGVVVGPGDDSCAHGKDEKIDKKELLKAVEIYQQIIKNYQK